MSLVGHTIGSESCPLVSSPVSSCNFEISFETLIVLFIKVLNSESLPSDKNTSSIICSDFNWKLTVGIAANILANLSIDSGEKSSKVMSIKASPSVLIEYSMIAKNLLSHSKSLSSPSSQYLAYESSPSSSSSSSSSAA